MFWNSASPVAGRPLSPSGDPGQSPRCEFKVSSGSVFSIALVESRAVCHACALRRGHVWTVLSRLVSGMTIPEEDADVGQGSKYCLVAIGRLQVRKSSRLFHPKGAPHLSSTEQRPVGFRAPSELAAAGVGWGPSVSLRGEGRGGAGEQCVPTSPRACVRPDTCVLPAEPASARITPVSSPG